MNRVLNELGGWLASGVNSERTGSGFDTRAAADRGFLFYKASGHSAIFNLEASPDNAQWIAVLTVTATATQTGFASVTGYFPYVRANVVEVYSAAGGSGNVWIHWTPRQL